MAELHKLTLRLDENSPREKAAWQKIKDSGMKQQQFLLHAVEAYRVDLRNLPIEDVDRIANRIIWRLEQIGFLLKSVDEETTSKETVDKPDDTDFEEEEFSEEMEGVLNFLEGL